MFFLKCMLLSLVIGVVGGIICGILFPESEEEKQRRLMKKNRRKKPYKFRSSGELLIE